jgi:hypothetical protein
MSGSIRKPRAFSFVLAVPDFNRIASNFRDAGFEPGVADRLGLATRFRGGMYA